MSEIRDTYIGDADRPFVDFSPGIRFKLLRASSETGTWTALFDCEAGSSFARHRHLGAGEYLMLHGKMEVRGGVEAGGVTAVAGDYGYEPSGVIHDSTLFVEPTRFFFINHGPVAFIDEQDQVTSVLDWLLLKETYEKAAAGA